MQLFKYFRLPIAHLTKLDMKAIAEKYNFIDIMNRTWSCFTPKYEDDLIIPCGKCSPCEDIILNKMDFRLQPKKKDLYI